MTYTVVIANSVRQRIATWKLPRETLLATYDRLLTVLPADPDKHLTEKIVPYADRWAYSFVLKDHTGMPHRITFAVIRDGTQLKVIGGTHIAWGPDVN